MKFHRPFIKPQLRLLAGERSCHKTQPECPAPTDALAGSQTTYHMKTTTLGCTARILPARIAPTRIFPACTICIPKTMVLSARIFPALQAAHPGVHPQLLAHAPAGGAQRADRVRLVQVKVGLQGWAGKNYFGLCSAPHSTHQKGTGYRQAWRGGVTIKN